MSDKTRVAQAIFLLALIAFILFARQSDQQVLEFLGTATASGNTPVPQLSTTPMPLPSATLGATVEGMIPNSTEELVIISVPGTPVSTQHALTLTAVIDASEITPIPGYILHTVESGETLFRISQNYGVTLEAIIAANEPIDPDTIYVGQVLNIPPADLEPDQITPLPTQVSLNSDFGMTPTPVPPRQTSVNGIAIVNFVVVPDNVKANIRRIYRKGQTLGRNPNAFSKLGDSTIETPHFDNRLDEAGGYNLGSYAYLQRVIDFYHGSFSRNSAAVHQGMHTWSVFDPMWAIHPACQSRETVLECEFRLWNPSVLIIRMGSNDSGVPKSVDTNLRKIVDFCLENGVIPILGTKADRFEQSNVNNEIIKQIALDYELPLWDFDLIAETIPGKGLGPDGVHMTTFYARDWTQVRAFRTGHGVHSLTALMMLDEIMSVLNLPDDQTVSTAP